MSLQKELLKEGDGKTYPKKGDNVTMEFVVPLPCLETIFSRICRYTGWLYESGKDKNRGKQ